MLFRSDAVFVSFALAALATLESVPLPLPVLVIVSFVQYVADSDALKGQPLRTSYLGRFNGISYYVLAGYIILQTATGLSILSPDWLFGIGTLLCVSTVVSMADRAQTLYRVRRRKNLN